MQEIITLFLFLVLCYSIYTVLFESKETYITEIVGYNNIVIPAFYIPNIFETETKELVQIFKESFKDDIIEPIGYKEHNPYIPFPFETPIKKFIIDYLKKNIDKFKGHKLEITSDLNKVYYKDENQDRLFIFNINLVDNTKFMTRNIRIKLKIKNILDFIKKETDYDAENTIKDAEVNYRTNIPAQTVINSIELLSIRLDKNNYARFEYTGLDSLKPNYYQIKNVLGLMDPFVTSGRDMLITDNMKKNFEKDIEEHQKLLKSMTDKN